MVNDDVDDYEDDEVLMKLLFETRILIRKAYI